MSGSEPAAWLPAARGRATPAIGPALQELTDWVFFSPESGRIWFDKQRALLIHASTFGMLRREILQALGTDRGRALIERVGYAHGKRDAELVRARWPVEQRPPRWSAGPRLHMLEGFVNVTPLRYELGPRGLEAEYLWADSVEADEHVAAFGPSREPVCWMLCAYAAGYAETTHGLCVEVEEVECRAAGHDHCRVIARPASRTGPARAPRRATEQGLMTRPAARDVTAIVGASAPLMAARRMLEQVAATDASVLLRGESGVGKELFATNLHRLSRRREKPFLAVNCAAIPEELVEAELFGVERGAFTGATASRAGRFERANGGTLFLDEIGLMSMTAQAKLLRVLQEQEIERVGGSRGIRIDVRVVAATNVDLWDEVQARRFRRDLFFRLNVFPIDLPPLRARRDDIPLLIERFLALYAELHGKPIRGLSKAALDALLDYDYPGNVRELQNLIERGVICAEQDGRIDKAHIFRHGELLARPGFFLATNGRLRASGAEAPSTPAPLPSLPELERQACAAAFEASHGNVSNAARQLGITRATLEYRLRKWGLRKPRRAPTAQVE